MENTFYVLKCGDDYLRFTYYGEGSVHLTSFLGQANSFNTKHAADEMLQNIRTNTEAVNLDTTYIVKVTYQVVNEVRV
jgi:hypothetical protein